MIEYPIIYLKEKQNRTKAHIGDLYDNRVIIKYRIHTMFVKRMFRF